MKEKEKNVVVLLFIRIENLNNKRRDHVVMTLNQRIIVEHIENYNVLVKAQVGIF